MRRYWTDEEVQILKEMAPKVYIGEVAKMVNRSIKATMYKASVLNIKYVSLQRKYSKKELNYIKDNWGIISVAEMARTLKVSRRMIYTQASYLNLLKIGKATYQKWTDEKINLLKALAPQKNVVELATYFDVTPEAIVSLASKKNIKITTNSPYWSDEEIKKFQELSKTLDVEELSKALGKTTCAIRNYARRKNIPLVKKEVINSKKWNNQELERLKTLVLEGKPIAEIAKQLNRSMESVTTKINVLGLKSTEGKKRYWTKKEEEILEELWGVISISELAKKLNRSSSSIKAKAYHLGFSSFKESNYEGVTFSLLSELLNVTLDTISVGWVALGLKYEVKEVSSSKKYRFVKIDDLYDFLNKNQNIWNSTFLEPNTFGKEPTWLKEKRKRDLNNEEQEFLYLTRQHLLNKNKISLDEKVRVLRKQFKEKI